MLFNSFAFILFFPVVCIVYFAIPRNNWRNYFLLAASYFFYMGWKPEYALLLLTSTIITYWAAICMSRWKKSKRSFLILAILLNLSILLC